MSKTQALVAVLGPVAANATAILLIVLGIVAHQVGMADLYVGGLIGSGLTLLKSNVVHMPAVVAP